MGPDWFSAAFLIAWEIIPPVVFVVVGVVGEKSGSVCVKNGQVSEIRDNFGCEDLPFALLTSPTAPFAGGRGG